MSRAAAVLPLLLAVLALGACSHAPAPVEESVVVTKSARGGSPASAAAPASRPSVPETHTVGRGETLYSIAFRYGLDFRAVAAANNIAEPYTIYPGQKLRLRAHKSAPVAAKSTATAPTSSAPQAGSAPSSSAPVPPPADARKPASSLPEPAVARNGVGWQWPVQGKLLSTFNANVVGPKGIALAGNTGDPVHAARDGRVVYIGSSLVGYGQLVILKHDDVYLSAYAHNSKVLVKEGDAVRAGDTIAEMGSSGTDRTKLHFEVRRNGDPIDPMTVLPRP